MFDVIEISFVVSNVETTYAFAIKGLKRMTVFLERKAYRQVVAAPLPFLNAGLLDRCCVAFIRGACLFILTPNSKL